MDNADDVRRQIVSKIARARRAEFGQFMTPSSVSRFMASLFPSSAIQTCRLLDAGAGVGALSCAFLDRWMGGGFGFQSVEATAYEIDDDLRVHLARHLHEYDHVTTRIVAEDYIEAATIGGLRDQGYTHAILNPPYKKIGIHSEARRRLHSVGIETVNLYSAFVALAVAQVSPGGQIVAVIPRSFCNGPHYRLFRDFILKRASIRHIHLFGARNKVFKDDKILQESVIICLERDGLQGPVTITTSTDDTFSDLVAHKHSFDRIVVSDDLNRFIHVPTTVSKGALESLPCVRYSLAEIGLKVSTGPIIDFRLKEYLRAMPEADAIPLIYPGHNGVVTWPVQDIKKSNAIMRNNETEKWFYPNGYYCVVRRVSPKEEGRRVVASVIDPAVFGHEYPVLGFENRLNLFHENKHGLPELLARGLSAFLNTTAIDEYFRCFSGHTQVNATDLRSIKYPSRDVLIQLGQWVMQEGAPTQDQVDMKLQELGM